MWFSHMTCLQLCDGRFKVGNFTVHIIDCRMKTCQNCGEGIKKIEEAQHLLACRPAVVPIFSFIVLLHDS